MESLEVMRKKTVGDIVAENYQTAQIFIKYGIDFCCGGKKKFEEACDSNSLNISKIYNDLATTHLSNPNNDQNFTAWDLAALVEYILQQHHKYVKHAIPAIQHLLEKIADKHGQAHPELKEIKEIFIELSEELSSHLYKEEHILFPYIKNLAGVDKFQLDNPQVCLKSIDNPVKMMETEHEEASILLKLIRNISQDYQTPSDACTSYKLAFEKLQEFEQDLFKHVHLENNILFPKALLVEKGILENLIN
jgi:regulator of cell morphogenesis and NO signaling